MDSFIWYDGMVHFHIERSHDLIYKYNCYSLGIVFILTYSVDTNELPHNVEFLFGPSLFAKARIYMRGSRKFCQRGSNIDIVIFPFQFFFV